MSLKNCDYCIDLPTSANDIRISQFARVLFACAKICENYIQVYSKFSRTVSLKAGMASSFLMLYTIAEIEKMKLKQCFRF